MRKVAVFIGAGASKPFGYLLTKDILPEIQRRLKDKSLFNDDRTDNSKKSKLQDLNNLEKCLNALLPGFNIGESELPEWMKKKGLELPLITDVLSLIDHALSVSYSPLSSRYTNPSLSGLSSKSSRNTRLTSRSTELLIAFRTLLERAIANVLAEPVRGSKMETKKYDVVLEQFAKWVRGLAKPRGRSLGIISTNYDTAIERRLFDYHGSSKVPSLFDFGFSWRSVSPDHINPRPAAPLYRFYKLHGSLNWLRCELCERIYINRKYSIAAQAFRDKEDDGNTCYCGHAPLRSVIVAPSLVRDIRDPNLLEIWKEALELLRTADEWIIFGYSFPPEDIAIRSLFIRAYQGRWKKQGSDWREKDKPDVTVVQFGEDRSTYSRYKLFFPDCDYQTFGLEGFLEKRLGTQ
jgi:hypothetical protein